MHAHITMAFFKSIIFSNIMQVISSYDNSPLHFHLLYDTGKNTTSDRNVTREWTFLVNVSSFYRLEDKRENYAFHFF